MDQLVTILNQIVAFFKSDTFTSLSNSFMTTLKSIDINKIIEAFKSIIQLFSAFGAIGQ